MGHRRSLCRCPNKGRIAGLSGILMAWMCEPVRLIPRPELMRLVRARQRGSITTTTYRSGPRQYLTAPSTTDRNY
eukprot:scaffold2820_cov160-Amphora_coffeaeformis.AAC.12